MLKLLKDSSKDVRDAAMTVLEKFYTYIGPSLLVRETREVDGGGVGDVATKLLFFFVVDNAE